MWYRSSHLSCLLAIIPHLRVAAGGHAPVPASVSLTGAVLTSKWVENSNGIQIIELQVNNTDRSNPILPQHSFKVSVASSDLVDEVQFAQIKRLFPNQTAVIQVGVKNKHNVPRGTKCSVPLVAKWGELNATTVASGLCGIPDYTNDTRSLSGHVSPQWFNDAKYGIFIHWGLYSVPAYGNVHPNNDYAEWYWKRQHEQDYKTKTYQYHLDTYGADFNYDDFLANFTASEFNASEWLSLVHDAGATYFVPVTKHHDGFALYDVPKETTLRSSVHYGPKRDFIKELFDEAKAHYPDIRRGTYFSMPEWYHPGYVTYKLGWGGGFPGGPPVNPYTGKEIPYTGYVEVKDFVLDLQVPQLNALLNNYDTDLLWCDIGGANNSTDVVSAWLNKARTENRQVTWNSRCGISAYDFDTPEYRTNPNIVVKKWETNRGMDPFSYGYNKMTPDGQYLTGQDIVKTLVDAVSKNGNFLLDIGPKADGTIPAIMQKGLRDAGAWIHAHKESIFGTRYWATTPGKDRFRYTTSPSAFYIHVTSKPGSTVQIPDPVPYLAGDKVTVVGGTKAGTVVPSTRLDNGTVVLTLSDEVIAADTYVWTFKIRY